MSCLENWKKYIFFICFWTDLLLRKGRQLQHERKCRGITHEHHHAQSETNEAHLSAACNETSQSSVCYIGSQPNECSTTHSMKSQVTFQYRSKLSKEEIYINWKSIYFYDFKWNFPEWEWKRIKQNVVVNSNPSSVCVSNYSRILNRKQVHWYLPDQKKTLAKPS